MAVPLSNAGRVGGRPTGALDAHGLGALDWELYIGIALNLRNASSKNVVSCALGALETLGGNAMGDGVLGAITPAQFLSNSDCVPSGTPLVSAAAPARPVPIAPRMGSSFLLLASLLEAANLISSTIDSLIILLTS